MYGAEKAFEVYGSSVSDKMAVLSSAGLDYDTLYAYYFGTKDIDNDLDKKGEVVEGSKRKNVEAAINQLDVSKEHKLILIAAKGYSLDGASKKRLLSYILSLKISKEEKLRLAEACGFEVKNGKILKTSL
jgi:hypothetical protein